MYFDCPLNPVKNGREEFSVAIVGHASQCQAAGVVDGADDVAVFLDIDAFLVAAFLADFAAFFRAGAAFLAAAFAFAALPALAFLRFATSLAFAAAESFRLGFSGSEAAGADSPDSPRTFAHRRCWASRIRRIAEAENFRRLRPGASGVAAVSAVPPGSMARSSAIC